MMDSMSLQHPLPDGGDDDLGRIGRALTRMRLMMGRRVIGRLALSKVAPELEISHLDVLSVARQAAIDGEATVGKIAEMMRVDPSRSSRMIAELVQRGVLRRDVSQTDARRAVVELTPRGVSLFDELHAVKTRIITDITADWEPEELAAFGVLFERFVTRFEQAARPAGKDIEDAG